MVTEMCSMYCRHCTRRRHRRRAPRSSSPRSEIENAIKYIKRYARGARRADLAAATRSFCPTTSSRRSCRASRAIDHVEIVRIGSRMPVVCPQRITPELCDMLKKYHPLFFNTHFNHPKEITEDSITGVRHAGRRRHPAGQPDGAHARHQRLRQRHEASLPQVWSRRASSLTTFTSATSPKAPLTSARASPRASRSPRACAATPPASRCRPTSSTPSAAAAKRRSCRST